MENELKVLVYDGADISFERKGDECMVNATDMARKYGKRVNDWFALDSTKSFIRALETTISGGSLVVTKEGRNGGTWMNQNLALEFARWLDPMLAVWCNKQILTLVKDGAVSLQHTAGDLEDRVNANYAALRHKKELLGLSNESVAAISNRIDDNLGLSTHLDYLPLDERGVAKAATVLLKENGSHLSTQAFFKLLLDYGIVEQRTHHGRNKEYRYYMLTEEGKRYGKNDTNPDHPEKVQIHFYESTPL